MPADRGYDNPGPWEISGRFIITGETQEQAEKAIEALERAGKRAVASVDIYTHGSDPA